MNIYHIWADCKDGRKDLEFVAAVEKFLNHFQESGEIKQYRITRRKLGFGPPALGDFHFAIEFDSLDALDKVFGEVAKRDPELWKLHVPVFTMAANISTALYRDFPDPGRVDLLNR
jgi:hypothetical protein